MTMGTMGTDDVHHPCRQSKHQRELNTLLEDTHNWGAGSDKRKRGKDIEAGKAT